jgi:dipeptidyl aminopeptidase/acylaminoacyl peptidase
MRLLRLLLPTAVLVILAIPATGLARPLRPLPAQEIAWTRGFDLMLWDSVNGVQQVTRNTAAYDPNLSSDGRYLVYTSKRGPGCYSITLRDLWLRRNLSLPGLRRGDSGDCAEAPHLSRDARLLVWSSTGVGGSDLFMYDVVHKRRVPLPANINSGSNEQSPSLSDDGRLLAFVSTRNGFLKGDDVHIYDISQLLVNGTASDVTPPALLRDGEQVSAEMSGDGSTIVWTDGRTLADKTFVFNRLSGQLVPAPALVSGQDTYSPAVNRNGSIVAVAHQQRDLGDTAIFLWQRATGAFSAPPALRSTLGDTDPTLAWPARVVDLIAPRLKLRCHGGRHRVTCVLRTNEAGRGKVTARQGGRRLRATSVTFRRAGKKTLVFRTRRAGTVRAAARLADAAGNVGRARSRARAR